MFIPGLHGLDPAYSATQKRADQLHFSPFTNRRGPRGPSQMIGFAQSRSGLVRPINSQPIYSPLSVATTCNLTYPNLQQQVSYGSGPRGTNEPYEAFELGPDLKTTSATNPPPSSLAGSGWKAKVSDSYAENTFVWVNPSKHIQAFFPVNFHRPHELQQSSTDKHFLSSVSGNHCLPHWTNKSSDEKMYRNLLVVQFLRYTRKILMTLRVILRLGHFLCLWFVVGNLWHVIIQTIARQVMPDKYRVYSEILFFEKWPGFKMKSILCLILVEIWTDRVQTSKGWIKLVLMVLYANCFQLILNWVFR